VVLAIPLGKGSGPQEPLKDRATRGYPDCSQIPELLSDGKNASDLPRREQPAWWKVGGRRSTGKGLRVIPHKNEREKKPVFRNSELSHPGTHPVRAGKSSLIRGPFGRGPSNANRRMKKLSTGLVADHAIVPKIAEAVTISAGNTRAAVLRAPPGKGRLRRNTEKISGATLSSRADCRNAGRRVQPRSPHSKTSA